jgi:hypothetical protein
VTPRDHRVRELERRDRRRLLAVLAGSSPPKLAPAATVVKTRQETAIRIRGAQRYVAVQPLDAQGATLATSHTVAVR